MDYWTLARWCTCILGRHNIWYTCRSVRSTWRKDGISTTTSPQPSEFSNERTSFDPAYQRTVPQPETQHVTHVYHTADPIAMGTCNGVFSSCALGGYAMESKCHLGQTIVYDTVSNLSWSVDIRTHTIATVIEKLLSGPWPPSLEDGREVPTPQSEDDCVVRVTVFPFGDWEG